MSIPVADPSAAPAAGELRGQIRDWRRGRANLAWGEVLTDAYTAVLAVLIFGSMLVSAVVHASDTVTACDTVGCHGVRAAAPVLVLLGWLAVGVGLVGLLGPVVASKATSAIVLATPVGRGGWLRRQYVLMLAAVAIAGAVVTALAAMLAGWPATTAAALAATAAVATALGYAVGALAQEAGSPRWWSWVRRLPGVLLLLGLVGVTLGGVDGLAPPAQLRWWLLPAGVAMVMLLLAVAAGRRLDLLRRRDLVRGHGLARGLAGALSGLDPALAYDVVLEQSAARTAHVRPRRGGLPGPFALTGADLVRLRRHPGRLVILAGALAVPYASASAGAGTLTVPVAIVAGFVAAIPFGAGIRVLIRTPGVSRLLGHPPAVLRLAALAVPGVLLVLYGIGAVWALPDHDLALGLAVGAGAWAALARWLMGAPPDYSKPLISTPMGAVPTNLYTSAIRGLDIAGLTSIPLLFAPNPTGAAISLIISAVVLTVLISRK